MNSGLAMSSNSSSEVDVVGRYYNDWTQRYRAVFGETFQACRPTSEQELNRYVLERSGIQDGDHILDAGCGICGPSRFFALNRKITIDAITVSEVQSTISRALIAEAGLDRQISIHLADYHQLESYFRPAMFDRVVFLESLSHATNQLAVLQGAFNVLKPGGTVYIKDFFEKQYETSVEIRRVKKVIERVNKAFALRTPRVSDTLITLERIGFHRVMTEPVGFSIDNAVWELFDGTHHFDLYGGEEPMEWSVWHELKFEKPCVPA